LRLFVTQLALASQPQAQPAPSPQQYHLLKVSAVLSSNATFLFLMMLLDDAPPPNPAALAAVAPAAVVGQMNPNLVLVEMGPGLSLRSWIRLFNKLFQRILREVQVVVSQIPTSDADNHCRCLR
jgi:hypothetical protein